MHVHLLLSSWESTVTIQQGDSDSGIKYVLILNFNLSVDPSVVESYNFFGFTINDMLLLVTVFQPLSIGLIHSVLWDMLNSILQFHF